VFRTRKKNRPGTFEWVTRYYNKFYVATYEQCDKDRRKLDQLFLINGILVPATHQWCCEMCATAQSKCFCFIRMAGPLQGQYLCWNCLAEPHNRIILRKVSRNHADTVLNRDKDIPVHTAKCPGSLALQAVGGINPPQLGGVYPWLMSRYDLDQTSRRGWLEQARTNKGALRA
jgi:hypothetical protein